MEVRIEGRRRKELGAAPCGAVISACFHAPHVLHLINNLTSLRSSHYAVVFHTDLLVYWSTGLLICLGLCVNTLEPYTKKFAFTMSCIRRW